MIELATAPAKIIVGRCFRPLRFVGSELPVHRDSFVLIESPRGCLKTVSILHTLMSRAARWPGKRWYLWRSTRTLLSDTVLPTFEEYVIPAWSRVEGMQLLNPGARPSHRSEYLFANGSVFTPMGMDDVQRGTSAEGAGGYIAEAIEIHERNSVTALVGMMRQPGVPFHQIMVDTNPGPPGHWLNEVAEPVGDGLRLSDDREGYERIQRHNAAPAAGGKWKRIIARLADNPYYFDRSAWVFTESGQRYIDSLKHLSSYMYARWVRGIWKAAEGSVFPEFGDRNICQPFPQGWPAPWPCWVFYDSGFDHPTGLGFYGIAPDGQHHVFDDCLRSGMNLGETAQWIKDRMPGRNIRGFYADPRRTFSETDLGNGISIADRMRTEHGIRFEPYPRKAGKIVQQQVEGLRLDIVNPILPLQVWKNCTGTISNFQSWRFKRNAAGEMGEGDDAYEDKNNDIIDPLLGLTAMGLKYEQESKWSFA